MGRIEVIRGLSCGPDKGKSHFYTSMGWGFFCIFFFGQLNHSSSFIVDLCSTYALITGGQSDNGSSKTSGIGPALLGRVGSPEPHNLFLRLSRRVITYQHSWLLVTLLTCPSLCVQVIIIFLLGSIFLDQLYKRASVFILDLAV